MSTAIDLRCDRRPKNTPGRPDLETAGDLTFRRPGSTLLAMRRLRRHFDLAAQATDQIRAAILRGDLCPRSRVRQEELAAAIRSVSRAPVREALVIRQGEGLVQANGSRGLIVTPLDPQVARDLDGFQ
jgi:DNA-binding GntR family transcriptional regulator